METPRKSHPAIWLAVNVIGASAEVNMIVPSRSQIYGEYCVNEILTSVGRLDPVFNVFTKNRIESQTRQDESKDVKFSVKADRYNNIQELSRIHEI